MNRFLLLFGGLWFLVGGSFTAGGIYLLVVEAQFARDAQTTTGTVLTKEVSRSTRSRGRSSTTYSVRYRFTAPGESVFEGRSDVPYDRWSELAERQPVDIAYLPYDPSRNRLRDTSRTTLAAIFTGVGGAFAIAGAVIAWFGIRNTRRHRRLQETGLVADAVVTDVRATQLRVNGRQQGRVHYEFRDAMGGLQSGKTASMSLDEAMRWKQGDQIRIRYDRDRPQDSIVEETAQNLPT